MLQKVKDLPVGPKDSKDRSRLQNFAAQSLWLVSTARNIIVVVCCGIIAYWFEHSDNTNTPKFILSGTCLFYNSASYICLVSDYFL